MAELAEMWENLPASVREGMLVAAKIGKGIRTRIFIGTALLFMIPPALGNIAIHPAWLPDLPYYGLAFYIPAILGVALSAHWLCTGGLQELSGKQPSDDTQP